MAATESRQQQRHVDEEAKKPEPLDFSHYYSVTAAHRLPSSLKQFYKFFQIPGIGQLAGGLPNVNYFPYDTLEAQAARPERWLPSEGTSPEAGLDIATRGVSRMTLRSDDSMAAAHIAIPKASTESDPLKRIDLATALQYGQAQGYPALLSWVQQFVSHMHANVPYKSGPDVILSCGSTDGMNKSLDLLVDPWSPETGDVRDRPGILFEPFMYPMILSQALPRGLQAVSVGLDGSGLYADDLEEVLANWDFSKGRRPHLMYTVTMGHNPTGIVYSLKRRQEIYAVCSKYDVIIIEDDPYYYLQYPSSAAKEAASRDRPAPPADEESHYRPEGWKLSGYAFLDSLAPSYLNVDTDGRVIRLDTFSKTIAPGCRLGWITAQPKLIERILRAAESSTQQPSGFVQSMVAELVLGPQNADALATYRSLRTNKERIAFKGWKMDGWVRWIEGLRGEYERRMNRMCRILDQGRYQLKQGTPVNAADADWGVVTKTQLFDYSWPRGGMFVWVRFNMETHPLWGAVGSDGNLVDGTMLCSALLIFLTKKPHLVLVSPGLMFSATEEVRQHAGWRYYRMCFAAIANEDLDDSSQRFVDGVQKYWKMKSVKDLEDLLEQLPTVSNLGEEDGIGDFGTFLGC